METERLALIVLAALWLFHLLSGDRRRIAEISRLSVKLDLICERLGIETRPKVSDRVKMIASDPKQKIQAIKAYREENGGSLRDAKEAIERLMERGP